MPRLKQLLFVVFVFLLTGGVASADGIKIIALPIIDLLRAEDRELVLKIKKSFSNPEYGITLDDLTINRLYIAMADLNGNGVQEFIVTVRATYNCGNMPTCSASVYQRVDGEPVFVGEVDVTESGWIWIEDTWSNDWRILNDGEYRYCWVPESNPKTVLDKDMFNMPYVGGQGGYFWSVEIDEECPVEHPHLD